MYGKHFESMYTGSMFGKGPTVFAVWGYVISHTRKDGYVELNPHLLAATIGCKASEIDDAIEFLCQPDEKSRSKDEDGRRMIREAEFDYRVVNYLSYRNILNEDERRDYNRQKQRESRARKQAASNHVKRSVNDMSAVSAHTDASASVNNIYRAKNAVDAASNHVNDSQHLDAVFERFWKAYPKRAVNNPKKLARKTWDAWIKQGVDPRVMIAGVERYARFCEATGKIKTEYVKQAKSWLGPDYEGWLQSWDLPADREATALAFPNYPEPLEP